MFGYIIVNQQEMRFREFDLYRSYYCGFCRELKRMYGMRGQLTLSYDLTFLILLLTSLYEEQTETMTGACTCAAHPFGKHPTRINRFSAYAADLNVLLFYYKCEDDWQDEHKLSRRAFGSALKRKAQAAARKYPKKAEVVRSRLEAIHACEQAGSENLDEAAGLFGEILGEIFAFQPDEWEEELRRVGFFLGKFVYLMDAYEDVEQDQRDGNYNPLLPLYETEQFEEACRQILTMMMADCSRAFERLPLLEHTEILRNILYSGVWCRYEQVQKKRNGAAEEQD